MLADLSAQEATAGYSNGEFSPVDVLDAVAERIATCEPTINALWDNATADGPTAERTRKAAQESAERWQRGEALSALDGVMVTVKENIARAGVAMPSGTQPGSRIPETDNAPIVDRLEEAGAVIVGSTVMPDWGMLSSGVSSLHGITRSPINPDLTTGGSSSGAGAAAVAGYGPIHIGSDIGGSIRLPGTWLGLATLKPSFGRIPLSVPYQGRCAGPLARRMSDVIAAMDIIGRSDSRDYSQLPPFEGAYQTSFDPASVRVAVHVDAGCGMDVDPQVAEVVRGAAHAFEAAGAQVEEIEPFMDDELLSLIDLFWRVRSYNDLMKLSEEDRAHVLPYVVQWCEVGADVSGPELMDAYNSIHRMRKRTVSATEPYDLVLSPVAPVAAFPAEWPMPFNDPTQSMGHTSFTVPYNMSEQPASTVHAGYTDDGRTVGVQVAGRRFNDPFVLSASLWLEQALNVELPARTVGV